jgi:hypothetical protein
LEQEDYLKRQIDQLGKALGKILADLLGLHSHGEAGIGIEAADQALKAELDLNMDDLTLIPSGNFIQALLEGRNLNNESLEKLAEILFLIAENTREGNKSSEKINELYERALILYEYTDKTGTTYSIDRHRKIGQLKRLTGKPGSQFA